MRKGDLQCFREWLHQTKPTFTREITPVETTKPNLDGMNSRQRGTLKWKLKKGIAS